MLLLCACLQVLIETDASALGFSRMTPCRLVDTRAGAPQPIFTDALAANGGTTCHPVERMWSAEYREGLRRGLAEAEVALAFVLLAVAGSV